MNDPTRSDSDSEEPTPLDVLQEHGLWPAGILDHLERGDLAEQPDLDTFARVIATGWYALGTDYRERLAMLMVEHLTAVVNGEPIEHPDGTLVAVDVTTSEGQAFLRQHRWFAEGLGNLTTAERFLEAVPAEVREAALAHAAAKAMEG